MTWQIVFSSLIYIYIQCQYSVPQIIFYRIYTLTGHFIRYTLFVPGWTPFCLQNCLNSSWHRFNKMLETFLRDFGPYWHDSITQLLQICCRSMIRISRSTTSQSCFIGLRSCDCRGHLSKVNSLSCSRNMKDDLSFVAWCIILLEVAIRRWVHCSHKGMDMVSNNTQVGCGI